MEIPFISPTKDYPKGYYHVNVSVNRGGHRERYVDVSLYPGKRSKEAAEKLRNELRDELKSIRDKKDNPNLFTLNTFQDIMDHFATTSIRKGKNKGTKRDFTCGQDKSRFERLCADMGKLRLFEIYEGLEASCEHWMDALEFEPSTCNRHIAIAKNAVRTAYRTKAGEGIHRTRLIPEDFLEDFPLYAEHNIKFRILTEEERMDLWGRLGRLYPPLQKLYYHALNCPMRMSHLVNIKREHCNMIAGTIIIPNPKNGRTRTAMVPTGLLHTIRNWPANTEYLHHDEDGKPLGYWQEKEQRIHFNRYKYLRQALKGDPELGEATIEGYNFHKTRQEAAMLMYQEGKTEDEIMLIGGWESRNAFYRYFNRELALQIRSGLFTMKTDSLKKFEEEIRKVA